MLVRRAAGLRGFAAVLAVVRAAGFFAADVRLEVPVADFARVLVERFAAGRLAVERFAVDRFAVERFAAGLRDDDDDDELARDDEPSSVDHLPDITRCAASATASAMIDPSLVALVIMLVAACDAVSAASRPASRILRRAAGLALIAAAAAAKPAASISLLIAALASLSAVVLLARDLEELLRGVFAMFRLPRSPVEAL